MKTGMTKREKIMLFTVGSIAIIYLAIQFLIIPLSTRYSEGLSERGRLNDEKAAHEIEVATLPLLRERQAEAYTNFDELTAGYPVIVENEEIDQMLTTLSIRNVLRPTSLRITPRPALAPAPEPEDGEEGYTPSLPEFTKATVQMTVVGHYNSMLRLLNDVSNKEYMRLTNLSFNDNKSIPELSRVSLTYEITFLNEK